jgi:hypothetical protein
VTVTFICTPGDEAEIEAVRATGEKLVIVDWPAGHGDFARKHNLVYQLGKAPYVLLAADDLEFEQGWDTCALRVAERSGKGVIGIDDDANPLVKRGRHATHPLVSRRYIDEVGGTWHDGPGVVYCELYRHQFVDTELCTAAQQRRQWAFSHGSVVRHLHPLYPKRGRPRTPMDTTYTKALGDAAEDRDLYIQRLHAQKHQRDPSML